MKKLFSIPVWTWVLIISLIPLVALTRPGLPVTHDGQDHVARIANFYTALSEGVLVPRWAGNLNWGYGHPILMFLYPLPSYATSLFHAFGMSLIDSTKLVFGLSYIASVLFMYLWLSRFLGGFGAVTGSLLYGFAPYRFVDLYVRGALGEHVAFIFPPLVCYFLYLVSKNQKVIYAIGLSISLGFLVLAHNAIAIMFLPIFALYAVYLLFFEVKNRLLFIAYCLLSVVLGFSLSAFFWVPAFFEGKFTLRDIVTGTEVLSRFVQWKSFVFSPWNFGGTDTLSKSLGFGSWISLAIAWSFIKQNRDSKKISLIVGSSILLLCCLFIMTEASKSVWIAITLLQKFQFPWRFLSTTTFLVAVIGAVGIDSIYSYFLIQNPRLAGRQGISKIKPQLLFIAYCLLLIAPTIGMWHPKAYLQKHESFFTGIFNGTTDTGESSPIWSIRFMEHTPSRPMQVIDGDAQITELSRSSTLHTYKVQATVPSRILENTLFFPGWRIYFGDNQAGLQFQDPDYRGLMTFRIDEGDHIVRVEFTNTKIRTMSEYLSLAAFGILIILGVGALLWKRKK